MQEQPVHLLVVDDRRENLLVVEAVLEAPELTLVTATSGEEALAQLSRHDFALILLDVRMPGMDGFETARRIRASARGSRTPIVFITAEDDLETEGYAAGAVDYLRKPFEPAKLRAKVAAFVEIWKHAREARTEAARAQATIILESITDAFYALDREWRFTYVNAQCERYFGLPREELLGRVIWEQFPMSRGTRFEIEYHRAVRTGMSVHFEEIAQLHQRWVEVTAYPSSEGLSVYFRDISRRKRIEAERDEQQRLLHFLVELNDAVRFVADPAGIMATVADRLGQHLQVSRCAYAKIETDQNHLTIEGDYTHGCTSIVGRHRLDRFGPRALSRLREGHTSVIHDVEQDTEPGLNLAAYGALQIRALICVPLFKDGRLVGSMAVHQSTPRAWTRSEVTLVEMVAERSWSLIERAQAAKQLSESEARFRQLADAMPQIVWTARPDGSVDYFNERWYHFSGLTRSTTGEESWTPILHPDDRERSLATWQEAVRTGHRYEIQYRFYDRRSQEYRWFLGRALPARDAEGEIVRWYGTSTDIDEQRRLFEALQESEERFRESARELAGANRRKDEFLAMLAHELRNPLAPIITSTQILRTRAVGDPVTQRHRGVIERQVRNMSRLIDDLLDTSRLQHGKVTLTKQRVDLCDIVLHALEAARPLLEEKRHSVSFTPVLADTMVYGDPLRLEQVVTNLLTNAAKYTEAAGEIQVRLERAGAEAVFSVRDSGTGISGDLLPYIFDAFTQGERSLDRAQGGLGVGLTMVKSLVELHGGSVQAHSAGPGGGSTFTVRLPLAHDELRMPHDEAQPAHSAPSGSPRAEMHRTALEAHRSRILVVDDNQDAADTLAELAMLWGYEVQTVYGGAEAVELAPDYLPDIALVDIGMPGMDGFQVARRLRQIPALSEIQIVAVTGYGRDEDRRIAREVGFDHHLVKPIDPEVLRTLLQAKAPVAG